MNCFHQQLLRQARSGAGRLALAATLVSYAHAAAAQDTDPAAEGIASGADIVVTGSRIPRPDLDAPSPVAIITEQQIERDGATNVQDFLAELPQVGIGTSRTNTNFSTSGNGVATVNLRNLGSSRTLVLVNGRRFVPGVAGTSQVDLNNIPADFISRVEVVTGGASAVYGSEAIAGVVNFILKDEFDGLQLRGQAGITSRGDNPRYLASLSAGTNFGADDRGTVLANFTYDRDEGLRSRERGISDQDCFLVPSPDECGPASYSTFAPQGRFQFLDADGRPVQALNGGSLFTFGPNNEVVAGFPTGFGFNRNAVRRIAVPVERYLATGIFSYDLAPDITPFAEVTYSKVNSRSNIEPFALGFDDIYAGTAGDVGLPITNPFIPAEIQALIAARNSDADPANDIAALGFRRRQNEVFDRSNVVERDTWRVAAGIEGRLAGNWNYELSYTYGRLRDFTGSEDIDINRYRNALDAVVVDGEIVCRSAAARAEGCVPINIFGAGTASPAAAAYVRAVVPKSNEITNTQHVLHADIGGTLLELPAGPLGVALGAEYRREKSIEDLDILTNTGGNSGNLLPDTIGSFDVREVFGELNVPLFADRPFFHDLSVLGAVRYSDYSTIGGVLSWNAGAEWSPVRGLRLRGVYAVANRAPNIGELFSSPGETFPTGILDPCEGVTATSTGEFDAACRAIPGVLATINAAPNGAFNYELADYQGINGFGGGNRALQEETAKTLTFGAVFEPRALLPGFSASVDYFDIEIEDAIDTVPRSVSIEECLRTGEAAFCDNVIRTPAGRLRTINTQLVNIADLETSGIDVAVRYSKAPGLMADDQLSLNLLYTYLISLEQRSFPGAPLDDNRGLLDGDGRLGAGFKHKASGRVSYSFAGFTASWQVNYLGQIKDSPGEDPFGDPDLNRINQVGDSFYHDVQLRWAAGDDEAVEFYLGADNLFDNQPPFLPSGFASNITGTETAADTFDPFGRRFYAGAQIRF